MHMSKELISNFFFYPMKIILLLLYWNNIIFMNDESFNDNFIVIINVEKITCNALYDFYLHHFYDLVALIIKL